MSYFSFGSKFKMILKTVSSLCQCTPIFALIPPFLQIPYMFILLLQWASTVCILVSHPNLFCYHLMLRIFPIFSLFHFHCSWFSWHCSSFCKVKDALSVKIIVNHISCSSDAVIKQITKTTYRKKSLFGLWLQKNRNPPWQKGIVVGSRHGGWKGNWDVPFFIASNKQSKQTRCG